MMVLVMSLFLESLHSTWVINHRRSSLRAVPAGESLIQEDKSRVAPSNLDIIHHPNKNCFTLLQVLPFVRRNEGHFDCSKLFTEVFTEAKKERNFI